MKGNFPRNFVFIFCVFALSLFGCDYHQQDDTPSVEIGAFDQTKEIQKNLSAEAQHTMEAMAKAQQVPQAVESLNGQQSDKTFQVPDAN